MPPRRARVNATGRSAEGFIKITARTLQGDGAALYGRLHGEDAALLFELLRIGKQNAVLKFGTRRIAAAAGIDQAATTRRLKRLIEAGALRDVSGMRRRAREARTLSISDRLRAGKNHSGIYVALLHRELQSDAFRSLPGAAKKLLPYLRFLAVQEGADPVGGNAEVRISGSTGEAIGLHRRTTLRALEALAEAGFIELVSSPAWGQMTRPGVYRVPMRPTLLRTAPFAPTRKVQKTDRA